MSDEVDRGRRRLLTAATVGTGVIGAAFAAVPFLASWQPSARAKALGAPVEVDADSQQPAYIKSTGAARARNPEYWIGLAVCTHLGCSPLGAFVPNDSFQVGGVNLGANWPGGFYCPCHGSKYDASGRVFKSMPAPKNLTVPPYAISADLKVVIGVDDAAKTVS